MSNRNPTKVDLICATIIQRIRDRVWKVGARIPTEQELSAEFKCSRGTVGNAISRLEYQKLVERRKRGGTRIISSNIQIHVEPIDLDAVAFIFPNDRHEGIRRMVRGFQDAACDVNRRVIMIATGTEFERECDILSRMPQFDVRGCVVSPIVANMEAQLKMAELLKRIKIPVVLAGMNLPGNGHLAVLMDGFHAALTMTEYLIGKGLKRIGFLSNNSESHIAREKLLGYRKALENAGIPYDPRIVSLTTGMTPSHEDPLEEPKQLARAYLRSVVWPEGVVCLVDYIAIGLIEEVQLMGRRVPQDLQIVGMDDLDLAKHDDIRLTTYRVPFEAIGHEAFRLLNRQLDGSPSTEQEIQLRGELVIRESA